MMLAKQALNNLMNCIGDSIRLPISAAEANRQGQIVNDALTALEALQAQQAKPVPEAPAAKGSNIVELKAKPKGKPKGKSKGK